MTAIQATSRTEIGKKVKKLRKNGVLPAVLYGEQVSSKPISVQRHAFDKTLKEAGESTLVTLELEGKPFNVLIHDVSYDSLTGNPIHADFYAVRMDKAIRATVPLEFVGESAAVKMLGGILVKVVQELEAEALPQDLPHVLEVDLSALTGLESKAFVKDIKLPKGVEIIADADEIIVLVEAPRTEEELKKLDEAVEGVADVKTEGEIERQVKIESAKEEETA